MSQVINKLLQNIISSIKKIKSRNLKIDSIEKEEKSDLLLLIIKMEGKFTPPIRKKPVEVLKEMDSRSVNYKLYHAIVRKILNEYICESHLP